MIAAVYGSPRKGGNTDILMDNFLKAVIPGEEVIRIRLREKELKPCIACGGCYRSGKCVFHDDIREIYSFLEKARAIVLTSPIYFASVSAQVKALIDRGQAYWANKYLLKRENMPEIEKAFFLSAGGLKGEKYFKNARLVVKTWLHTLDIEYAGGLFYGGVDGKGEINDLPGAVSEAIRAGDDFFKI